MDNLFVFDCSYLNSNMAPGKEVKNHHHNEKVMAAKTFKDDDFDLDLDFIIETKPKPEKVIEYFQEEAKKLNEAIFQHD